MNLIAQAEKALVRNWRAVALYLLGTTVVLALYFAGELGLDKAVPRDSYPKPVWYVGASLLLDIFQAIAIAALQALTFARIGAEIDRPLWKYAGPADALRRFFVLWFIVALIFFAISQLQFSMYQQGLQHAVDALELPRLFWICASVPAAVCIMYGGELKWDEIPDRLSPLFHLFPKALIAFMLGFLQYFLYEFALLWLADAMRAFVFLRLVVQVPIVLLECLTFAVMWLVCMEYRDTATERDDDFDF